MKEIQEQAKTDFDLGRTAMKPGEVRQEFADQAKKVGLANRDIVKTYDDAYRKAKKVKADADEAKKTAPKEIAKAPLRNPIEWLIGLVVGALIALFTKTIVNTVTKIWSAVNTWIYQRFSGTLLFRNIALRKYRQALIDSYQTLKIPFRRDRFAMADVYVPLKVVEKDHKWEDVESKSTEEGLRQARKQRRQSAIDTLNLLSDYKRLMVVGEPGSGKTMLLRYLALNYGTGKLRLVDEPIVVLLELHRLSGGTDITSELVEALARSNFPNGKKFLEQALKKGQLVLLLDGLDEVNSSDRPEVEQRIKDFLKKYPCRVVITCRTRVYQNEFDNVVDQTLEVIEFTDAQIQQFLRPWKDKMPPEKPLEQLVQALNDRPRIKELARNPLLLTIISHLYSEPEFVLPSSRAEFYREATERLLRRDEEDPDKPEIQNQFTWKTKRGVLRHLALYAQDSSRQRGQDRKSLSFRETVDEVKSALPDLNLDREKAEGILDEIVERSGLLLRIDGGDRYQFSHLTLQEFFAASALTDNPKEMNSRVKSDMNAWREVVKLWCGLAEDSTNVIRSIYANQPLLAFECLADAEKINAALANEMIQRFQQEFGQVRTDDSVEKAFAAVAADARPRGSQIFEFLAETVIQPKSNTHKILAMNALSLSNLPKAARTLAQHYTGTPDSRQAMVRMGDLAIGELSKLAEAGHIRAIDDLMMIGTPEAARAILPFLWSKDDLFAGESAWYLGTLISNPATEELLHRVQLTPEQTISNQWDWIWEPFPTPHNSSLPKITARIAELLNQHVRSVEGRGDAPLRSVDPRLTIPICAFNDELVNHLPTKLSQTAENLLTASPETLNFNQAQECILELLPSTPRGSTWRDLLRIQPLQFQLRLLSQLVRSRKPRHQDWFNLFRRVKFDFVQSWQYRAIILLSFVASIGAIAESIYLPFQDKEAWSSWLLGIPILVIVYAWIFIWQGIPGKGHNQTNQVSTRFIS